MLVALAACCAGCTTPGPALFPPAPLAVTDPKAGNIARCYDLNNDGAVDYSEQIDGDGRVCLLQFSGTDAPVAWPAPPADSVRDLVILLDSVPFEMVADLWRAGRFRNFAPPSRVIAPFPVMTDLCFSEFFGVAPCLAIEAQFYDGHRLSGGYGAYVNGSNTAWLDRCDYHLFPLAHGVAYLDPEPWFDHELGQMQREFLGGAAERYIGYCVSTSALGALRGRDGHQAALVRLDRFCQYVIWKTHGRVRITLLSDHGHNLVKSRRIDLRGMLSRFGYHVTDRLDGPEDVIVPEFGIVTCAALHTRSPAAVAGDLVGVDGVQLAAYLDPGRDEVVVLGRAGRARIARRDGKYAYLPETGDPLRLSAIAAELRGSTGDEFIEDRRWFDATVTHEYPDAPHRLWRSFHGLVRNTPDVLVSVEDGWHCGSAFMTSVIDLAAAHGNLGPRSSSAFAMTTAGALPPVLRTEDLHAALTRLGVRLPPRP